MFVTQIMMNRKPGGNGAHSDTAENLEELTAILKVLEGTDGWAQLIGPGKFMAITGGEGKFAVSVGLQEQPPRRFTAGKVELSKAIEAAKAFAQDGRMLESLTWNPEQLRPTTKPAQNQPQQNKVRKAS